MLLKFPRSNSRIKLLRPLAGLLLVGLGFAGSPLLSPCRIRPTR